VFTFTGKGKPIAFEGDIRLVDAEAQGFFYCEISCPLDLEQPIIQRRIQTVEGIRSIAGVGNWKGWIYSREMDNAKKFGYTFTIIRGYKFKEAIIFKDYILKMYELRQKYPSGTAMNLVAKLGMNSLYGKIGMKTDKQVVEIIDTSTEAGNLKLSSLLATYGENIQNYFNIDKYLVYVIRKEDLKIKSDGSSSAYIDHYHGSDVNVAVASAITAGGRISMSRFKNNPNVNLYYTDTDSVIIDNQLHPSVVGPGLGQFKLEKVITEYAALAPKTYATLYYTPERAK